MDDPNFRFIGKPLRRAEDERLILEAVQAAADIVPQILTEGLVITIEPIIASQSSRAIVARDGWTMRPADRGLAAHHEHTLIITKNEPLLLTAA